MGFCLNTFRDSAGNGGIKRVSKLVHRP
uniref:Uncharacterized protein n=1 Tax=Rhizophora mucronata TaxID=61149 RepID=A0A2P2QBM9_RHIMU